MVTDFASAATALPFNAFDFTRRSNPSAAFAELLSRLQSALRGGGELARAVELFKGGVFVGEEDGARLAALEKRGVAASRFRVGSLPPQLGPGLALIYDATLEVLRSSDRIRLDRLQPRSASLVAQLAGSLVPAVGSASVAALEMAARDPSFADRLSDRASELTGVMELDDPVTPPFPCEHCTIVIEEKGQPPQMFCGTKSQCNGLLLGFLLLILIGVLKGIGEWLF